MSQTSRAAQLQALALSIATRKNGHLGLDSLTGRQYSDAVAVAAKAAQSGRAVVVLGGGSGELGQALARQWGPGGSVLLVEEDGERLKRGTESLRPLAGEGWSFIEGPVDDLRTHPAELAERLTQAPATDLASYRRLQEALERQRQERPLVPDASRDTVLIDGLAGPLTAARLRSMAQESFRVLHRGGSLIVCGLLLDEPLPSPADGALQGLPLEKEAADLLTDAGFHGIAYLWRSELPWKISGGVEARAFVLQAFKGKQGPCFDHGHAVIYKGPWREVLDDDGHRYVRGERAAVCKKTFELLNRAPYQGQFIGLRPYVLIPEEQAPLFDCNTPAVREPAITKGTRSVLDAREKVSAAAADCSGEGCC